MQGVDDVGNRTGAGVGVIPNFAIRNTVWCAPLRRGSAEPYPSPPYSGERQGEGRASSSLQDRPLILTFSPGYGGEGTRSRRLERAANEEDAQARRANARRQDNVRRGDPRRDLA